MRWRSIRVARRLPWPVVAACLIVGPAAGGGDAPEVEGRVPVLVELFTSEGCSSCPPADEFLSQLRRVQPIRRARIIALSEHVDYWNDLGWSDPYSSRQFTARQGAYGRAFGNERVYTPQMIVDGIHAFVANDRGEAMRAITRSTQREKADVLLTRLPPTSDAPDELALEVRIPEPPAEQADVVLALAEDDLSSNVSRGENTGRELRHDAVVRELRIVGHVEPGKPFRVEPRVRLQSAWQPGNLRAVVFIQQQHTGAILGLAQVELGSAMAGRSEAPDAGVDTH